MHFINEPRKSHNNNDFYDQDHNLRLSNALSQIDIGTAISIIDIINDKNNETISEDEWINRIQSALNFVDRGMLKSNYPFIKRSAQAISNKIKKLALTTNETNPDVLITLYYTEHNDSIQAPLIRKTAAKDKEKYFSNIQDAWWWQKNLQKTIGQNREQLRRLIGLVNDDSPYASDQAVKSKKISDKRKEKSLEKIICFSKKTGTAIKLGDVMITKEQNFSEKWCILKGIDDYAKNNGMLSAMITITAPAEYHSTILNINRLTTRDANDYISKKWHKTTKSLFRFKNQHFVFRVVEANVDGTPHWHILIFFDGTIKLKLQSILTKAFKVTSLDTPLIKWQDTDRSVGSFLSYVAKSIVPASLVSFNTIMSGNNDRIDTLRSLWNIRATQFSGLPKGCITAWRELRKVVNRKVDDKKVRNFLKQIKDNNFNTFLTAYLAGDIVLQHSADKKTTDIQIFGFSIFNQQEEPKNKNVKVNPNNNLNNRIIKKDNCKTININTLSKLAPKSIRYIIGKIGLIYEKLSQKLTITPIYNFFDKKTDSS